MLVIAVVAGVSIKITKAKLDNIISYTYYMGYSTLRNVTGQMLGDFKSTDEDYMQTAFFKKINLIERLFSTPVFAKTIYRLHPPYQKEINIGREYDKTTTYISLDGYGAGTWRDFSSLDDLLDYCKVESPYYCGRAEEYKKCSGVFHEYTLPEINFAYGTSLGYYDDFYKNKSYKNLVTLREYSSTYDDVECNRPCTNNKEYEPNPSYNCGSYIMGNPNEYGDNYFLLSYSYVDAYADNPEIDSESYSFKLENYTCSEIEPKLISGTKIKFGDSFDGKDYSSTSGTSVQPSNYVYGIFLCKPKPGNIYPPYEIIEEDTPTENVCSNQPSEATIRTEYCQNQQEWQGYPTCGYKPVPCNQDGYRWSKNSCACVPETATLPRKGANFCEKFLDYTNTKSTAEECNGDAIASNLTDFTDKKADIVLRNGLKLYNVRQNPAPLPLLAGNNQGGSYELADGTTVNVNAFGYTVYLDIDGEKGSSTLWEDVFPFYITMAGKVIPLYHTEGDKEYGGTSRQHLMTSVQKEVITTTGHRQVLWIRKSVPFKESACTSGYINSTTPYCSGVSLEPTCNEGANVCILKYVSPVKFF